MTNKPAQPGTTTATDTTSEAPEKETPAKGAAEATVTATQPTPPTPGTSAPTLTPRQQQLLTAARREIEADPHYKTLNNPTFNHAEVTPGLDETERGYLYLRYAVPGSTPQEFWAHVSGYVGVKWRTGEVSVPLD